MIQKMDKTWQIKCNDCYKYDPNDFRMFQLSDFLSNPVQQIINNQIFHHVQLNTNSLKKDALESFNQTLLMIKESFDSLKTKGIESAQIEMQQLVDRIQFDNFKKKINSARDCYHKAENANLMKSINDEINQMFSYDIISLYLYKIQQFIAKSKKQVKILVKNLQQTQQLLIQQMETLEQYCEDLDKVYQQTIKLVIEQNNTSLIKDLQEFPTIQCLITQGRSFDYELIYQGSRDGLDSEEYWKRCNLQENLLTIMTSENGNIFGGYSPCFLDCSIPQYIEDPHLKSFIFQYNKKQIYQLKNQQYAVYANKDYGPTYGNGHDLTMNSDFEYGSTSNFGLAYDTTNYQIDNKYTHLFGDFNPKLVECKVYRVKFT